MVFRMHLNLGCCRPFLSFLRWPDPSPGLCKDGLGNKARLTYFDLVTDWFQLNCNLYCLAASFDPDPWPVYSSQKEDCGLVWILDLSDMEHVLEKNIPSQLRTCCFCVKTCGWSRVKYPRVLEKLFFCAEPLKPIMAVASAAEAPEGVLAKCHGEPCEDDMCECCVCGTQYSEAQRTSTRFKDHCSQCSLDLRNIRKACGDDQVENDDEDDGTGKKNPVTIKDWLSSLQRTNLKEYREVFGRFKKQTLGITGRGKKKADISGGSILQFKESDEHRQRTKQSAKFEPMTMSRYCQYFTGEDDKMSNMESERCTQ